MSKGLRDVENQGRIDRNKQCWTTCGTYKYRIIRNLSRDIGEVGDDDDKALFRIDIMNDFRYLEDLALEDGVSGVGVNYARRLVHSKNTRNSVAGCARPFYGNLVTLPNKDLSLGPWEYHQSAYVCLRRLLRHQQ